MAKVRDFRLQIEKLDLHASLDRSELKAFLNELARLDDLQVSELVRRMSLISPSTQTLGRQPKTADESALLGRLKAAFESDAAFQALLGQLADDRSVGRAVLNRLYNALFGRGRPLPSKATRERLLRDIADERNAAMRSRKAAAFLSGE